MPVPSLTAEEVLTDFNSGGVRYMRGWRESELRSTFNAGVEHWLAVMAMPTMRRSPPMEGWDLFNADNPLTCGVERYNERVLPGARLLDSDAAALRLVVEQSMAKHPYPYLAEMYRMAVVIHSTANELRRITWGPAWVQSRCGPRVPHRPPTGRAVSAV